MQIQIKKLDKNVKLPQKALRGDAGYDLFANEDTVIAVGSLVTIKTGVAIKIEEGFVGRLCDKSGMACVHGLKIFGGVVDSNYTGEWLVTVKNLGTKDFVIKKGQKITQILFHKIEEPEIKVVEELPETNRGGGGFGHTGSE